MSRLGPDAAEAQRQRELAIAGHQVDLAGERHVSVFRASVVPGHLVMLGEILPSIGEAGEARCHLSPGNRAGKGQGDSVAVGEQGGRSFVVADPAGIFPAAVRQMRRQQRIQAIVGKRALEGDETYSLQHDIAVGIGKDFLLDPVAALQFGIRQFVNRNTGLDGVVFKFTVTFFFGEVAGTVGDNQSLVAGAGLVHSRVVHFVQDAVAEREPYPAVQVEGGAYAGFGARSPARRNPRPARRIAFNFRFHSLGSPRNRIFVERILPSLRVWVGHSCPTPLTWLFLEVSLPPVWPRHRMCLGGIKVKGSGQECPLHTDKVKIREDC